MRVFVTFTAVAVLAGAAGKAAAADLGDVFEPPYVAPHAAVRLTNWTGFHVGAGVGGVMFADTVNRTFGGSGDFPAITSALDTLELGRQGVLGSIQAGYDVQLPMSRWVAGAFIDYDWLSASVRHSAITVLGDSPRNWEPYPDYESTLESQWSVGGRLGWLFTPETLVYGLAAYTTLNRTIEGTYTAFYDRSTLSPFSFSDDVSSGGWSLGAGLETRLYANVSLKFEYRYSQFGDERALNIYTPGLVGQVTEDIDTQTARLVLSYKFNPFYRW